MHWNHGLRRYPMQRTIIRRAGLSSKDADGGENDNFNRLFGDANVNVVGRTDPVINARTYRVKFMLSKQQFW